MTEEKAMVANPRKEALSVALSSARPEAAGAADALNDAISAMKSKAWESGAADSFFAALTANDKDAGQAGQDCVDALQRAHDRLPDTVPSDSLPTN
jgi:hypothetical protein